MTPTDDEIVAHMTARYDLVPPDKVVIREALRLAREGLPVQDEALSLWNTALACRDEANAIATIRDFLAKRDAERDVDVLATYRPYMRHDPMCDLVQFDDRDDCSCGFYAALAKLERKP